MSGKGKHLIRRDLAVLERIENLEHKVFNVATCSKCKKDFSAGEVSANNKYKIPTCIVCFCKILERDKDEQST